MSNQAQFPKFANNNPSLLKQSSIKSSSTFNKSSLQRKSIEAIDWNNLYQEL